VLVIFAETALPGVLLLTPERHEDERGYFANTWSRQEFAERGLVTELAQCSVSYNRRCGTLRGLHWQAAPHAEIKQVRCTRGALFDVAVDVRPTSPTFGRWVAAELTAENGQMLYLPMGFAHGYQTLADDTEVYYLLSASYHPQAARGVRWDDATLKIAWPLPVTALSERDGRLPLLAQLPPD
jgi:dTDP-4-dehydrorhamnose 3,5-epimerase